MRRIVIFTVLIFMTLIASSCCLDRAASDKPVTHPFLCSDYGGNKICIVSDDSEVIWELEVHRPQDVWQLPNGNIMFTHLRGVKEVTWDKELIWEYKVEAPNEVQSCQPLGNGDCLVAVSGPCELLEIRRDGSIAKKVKLVTSQLKPHAQMRQVRKLANGNYLVGHVSDLVAREYDTDGKVVRTFEDVGNCYGGVRLANGNTILACGDGHKLVEVDGDDKVVWQLNENDLPGNPLRFVAGIQRLPNGNTVVCNWGGHGHVGEQPQIFEVTPDKKVVWQVFDFEKFGTIS
ncbi:MAG: hypothetical protein KAS23_00630, partial [Anaerohalosphaera sp.]|nr:hypothetical protein [Anaerohalosphaera sp.]